MFKPITFFIVRFTCLAALAVVSLSLYSCHTSKMAMDEGGFIQIFNGKNLNNRVGDSTYRQVEDSSAERYPEQNKFNWKKLAVLVYTKNGKGYVHANIPAAVALRSIYYKAYAI